MTKSTAAGSAARQRRGGIVSQEPTGNGLEIGGYYPGLIGDIVGLHATYYKEHWGFDVSFEAEEAAELGQFMLRFDPTRDGVWAARDGRGFAGGLAVDAQDAAGQGARLRWFIVRPDLQGSGLGWRLICRALGFCRERRYARAFLWTFQGLEAAKALYLKAGFAVAEERLSQIWGGQVLEQRYDLTL